MRFHVLMSFPVSRDRALPFFSWVATLFCVSFFATNLQAQLESFNGRAHDSKAEGRFLTGARQLIYEGRRSGEGYFDRSGTKMVFQSERHDGNPFYQIYVLDLETGDVERVSPGHGKTTCAWIHPDGDRILYASTHDDPDALKEQKDELDFRASGKERRYAWDYDEYFEIYACDRNTGKTERLTDARGYDAEGSYSPDGHWIAFSSNRHAYGVDLPQEQADIFETDKSYMLDLYIMRADGSDVRRLTNVLGYDGGPFFSPDGSRICFRRFTEDGATAEIHTITVDGTDEKNLTDLGAMSWAPYYHPTGEYLIFTTNRHGFANFELYLIDVEGQSEPVRVSYTDGFDGLPVFSPDGKKLAWTTQRTPDGSAQIFMGDWNHQAALNALAESRSGAVADGDSANVPKTASDLDADDLKTRVKTIVSLSESGRVAGTDASRKVATSIVRSMQSIGIQPGGDEDSWFQTFDLNDDTIGLNVLGRIPTDNQGRAPVILGAHYDASFSGADNNGSGVAVLLEVAEYLVQQIASGKFVAQCDIVLAFWDGGELGALGAKAFVGEYGGDAGCCYLNLDSVGKMSRQLTVFGVGSSTSWRGEIERRNVPVGLPLALEDRCDLQDDSRPFFDSGVPILSLTTSRDPRASDETDVAESLDFESAAKIAKFVALLVRGISQKESSPQFVAWSATETEDSGGKPYLGTIPKYKPAAIPGVPLEGVAPEGPAYKAGLRAGDIIVHLAGKEIATIQDYADILDTLRPNETVTIEVIRGEERLKMFLTPGRR